MPLITTTENKLWQGLSQKDIPSLQKKFGKNIFYAEPPRRFYHILMDIVKEPMFILLMVATALYFILGETEEGIMMLVATAMVAAISVFQDLKSSNAIQALKQFTQPEVTVIRDGTAQTIIAEELVPGDIVQLEEGMNIPADAVILQQNDFSVNESVITGESMPAEKDDTTNNKLFQGTTINSGKAVAKITATGNNTELGKLGKAVGVYEAPKTLLQNQIGSFVKKLALFGFTAFFIIFIVNFIIHKEWIPSLLFALTLAMSVIPEEIPVAFSSFMTLGAYKMSRLGIISRQPQVVENLGAVSVVCLDKTGTITENKMQVKAVYDFNGNKFTETGFYDNNVLYYGVLASEADPFDAMEQAIWAAFRQEDGNKNTGLEIIHEYPLEGRPPMMTHVYDTGHGIIAAAKGAMERIMKACRMSEADREKAESIAATFTSKGYRVIAVSSAEHRQEKFPEQQDDFKWRFEGLLALYDPPKENIKRTFSQFKEADIDIKIITGDHPATTVNIAAQVGIDHRQKYYTGDAIMAMSEKELSEAVGHCSIFARMFPDAKLKVVEALKANGEIVAMTGDGVNDGPALKAADIGIAMGKKGTEIARQAADLVLTDDNLERIVVAVSEGRKIFSNLKKAVRYIISIHIPILLLASIPLILGWKFPNIFTPVHIIFLEIIMGPTCSIFFEREPVEKNLMLLPPRNRDTGLFTLDELLLSIVQGVIIAAFILILYYYFMNNGAPIEQVRAIVFTMLIQGNMFLTFANRSFSRNIFYTIRYKNILAPFVVIVSMAFLAALYYIPAVQQLFGIQIISVNTFLLCIAVSFASVMWIEVYKTGLVKREE